MYHVLITRTVRLITAPSHFDFVVNMEVLKGHSLLNWFQLEMELLVVLQLLDGTMALGVVRTAGGLVKLHFYV